MAKNTMLLYVRMLLMMFIGLFTSRVVLKTLGVENYGVYAVVYEMVMLFSVISNSVSNAIGRFMAYEIGRGDLNRQQRIFSSALLIQTALAVLLSVLTLCFGIWYLKTRLVLPPGREDAAMWTLVTCAGLLIVQMYSIPFNATIIANEDAKAFAWISILEAVLKLVVALLLSFSPIDKLVAYSLLMLAVGLIVRSTYAWYCKRSCPQTQGKLVFDRLIVRQMLSFSGWSFLGSGVTVLNTRGISLLANSYFGVGVNASRGIALQVENIVRQLVSNFLVALNPQIIKRWAEGNKDYCYNLVGKGCKFSILIMSLVTLPVLFEADMLLEIWLGEVPDYAADFTRLALLGIIFEMGVNPVLQIVLSTGKLSKYYIITSLVSASAFGLSYMAFRMGYDPRASYWIFIVVTFVADIAKILIAHRVSGIKVGRLLLNILSPLACALLSSSFCAVVWWTMDEGWIRLLVNVVLSVSGMALSSYFLVLTIGERRFVCETIGKLCRKRS